MARVHWGVRWGVEGRRQRTWCVQYKPARLHELKPRAPEMQATVRFCELMTWGSARAWGVVGEHVMARAVGPLQGMGLKGCSPRAVAPLQPPCCAPALLPTHAPTRPP